MSTMMLQDIGRRVGTVWCGWSLAVSLSASLAQASSQRPARTTDQLTEAITRFEQLDATAIPYDVVFRRDPLRALVDANGQRISSSGFSGGLLVEGIIWSQDHPLAVIDDELVAAGQTVGPYTVREIHRDGVVVQRGEETHLIPLDRGLQ